MNEELVLALRGVADHLAVVIADVEAACEGKALLAPYEPEHVVHVGDVWGHSGKRYVVTHALEDGWVALDHEDRIGDHTWMTVDDLTRENSPWFLRERDGKPWPPAQDSEPAAQPTPQVGDGVEPATDEQIEAWDGWPLTTHRASMVIARVRQEQARADSEERGRHQIEDERDTLARRIDHVRTMCADAQVAGGYLRPDAVLYVLDGEPPEAKGPEKEDDRG